MQIHSPRHNTDLESISDLFAQTFSDYWVWHDYTSDGYLSAGGYDWEASRVAVVDGRIVGHFGVWERQMRIGSAAVKVAAIGAVATHQLHRKKGYMEQTARACLDGLRDKGYDVTFLFGIPRFYTKFGYVRSFPEAWFFLDTRDNPGAATVPEHADGPEDLAEFARIYNEENKTITGTFVRPTYRANRRPKQYRLRRFADGYLYLRKNGDTLEVVDCAGPPEQVVAVARDVAYKDVCPTISFPFLPRRSRVGEYLIAGGHRYDSKQAADGGPMFSLVNLRSTSQKLAPVWAERLAKAGWSDYSGSLLLSGNGVNVVLQIDHGRVTVGDVDGHGAARKQVEVGEDTRTVDGSIRAGTSLVRLFVGDEDPHRIVRQSGATVGGDARFLLPVLFPHEEPSTIAWDRF